MDFKDKLVVITGGAQGIVSKAECCFEILMLRQNPLMILEKFVGLLRRGFPVLFLSFLFFFHHFHESLEYFYERLKRFCNIRWFPIRAVWPIHLDARCEGTYNNKWEGRLRLSSWIFLVHWRKRQHGQFRV